MPVCRFPAKLFFCWPASLPIPSFLIGHYGGRTLLNRYGKTLRIRQAAIRRGEDLFARYGAATIFVARFIAGMRVIAGPLAGVLGMDWRRFVIFNFLGAALWVTVIASIGYLFGRQWNTLLQVIKGFNLVVVVAAAGALGFFWLKRRHRTRVRIPQGGSSGAR